MDFLFGALAIVSGAATLYTVYRRRFVLGCGAGYLCAIAVTWLVLEQRTEGYRPPPKTDPLAGARPEEIAFDGYASSDTCRACHPGEYHSWHATYHRTMTQVASPESVLADIDNRIFEDGGLAFAVEKRGDEVWTKIFPGKMAAPAVTNFYERKFVMTTGSHHYQVYWLDGDYNSLERADDRRITVFPYAFLLEDRQWIPRHAAFLTPPHADMHSLESASWNTNCLNCHSTHGVPQARLDDQVMTTRAVEFGIACESCHGPGEAHLAANRDPLRRYQVRRQAAAGAPEPDATIVNPARLGHEISTHVCAQCHSLSGGYHGSRENYMLHGYGYQPGQDLHQTLLRTRYSDWKTHPSLKVSLQDDPEKLRNYFWSDGMIRVAGREYNGLLETPCYQAGEMTCLSCHQLHKRDADPRSLKEWADDQLGPGMRTSAACTQCHEKFRDESAVAAHTHHPVASAASDCYNCHMPHTTYGLLKGIRSHQVDSPSVAASIATGRPNACNQCHLDKSLAWTAQALAGWYGAAIPEMNADEREVAAGALWALKGDAGQRALMAWSFGWDEARETAGDDWMPAYLALLLEDPYVAVKLVARRSLAKYPGYESLPSYPFPADMQGRALSLWKGLHAAGLPSAGAGLLIQRDCAFDTEKVQRLLSERDQTPIHLSE